MIKFTGMATRKLKDGSITGMIEFPPGTDRVLLLALEDGGVINREQAEVRPAITDILSEIRAQLDHIGLFIEGVETTNLQPIDTAGLDSSLEKLKKAAAEWGGDNETGDS